MLQPSNASGINTFIQKLSRPGLCKSFAATSDWETVVRGEKDRLREVWCNRNWPMKIKSVEDGNCEFQIESFTGLQSCILHHFFLHPSLSIKMQKAAVHWQTYPFLPFSHVISTWNWGSWQLLEELEHVTYLACLCHAWRTEIPRTKTLQHFPRATLSENVEMLRDAKTSTLRCPKWSVRHHSCLVCKWARTYRASPVMVVIFESCKDPSKPEKHAVICTMILRLAGTLTRAFF